MILKDSEWRVYIRYSADIAQDDYDKKAKNKGLNLKIRNDYNLAAHIENKILNERYSPDAVIMESNSGKHEFETSI